MKGNERYLLNQVFSAVIIVVLGLSFYMLAVTGMIAGIADTFTPMLLIIIAIILLAMLSEVERLAECCSMRSKK